MNEKIKMRILHLIDLGARYEDSSELKEIIDQHSNARELYNNLLKSEENLTNFYGSIHDKKISERFDQIIEEGLNPKKNKDSFINNDINSPRADRNYFVDMSIIENVDIGFASDEVKRHIYCRC